MSPTMRPSSTRRFTPSSAIVAPKALRRPRASMHAMGSGLLLWRFRPGGLRLGGIQGRSARLAVQKVLRLQAEALNRGPYAGPFLAEKPLPLALEQETARAGIDEHATPAPGLDELL